MATQVTNYQCPTCTAPLHFDGPSGKLVCDYCGGSYEVAEIEAMFAEANAKAAQTAQEEQTEKAVPEGWGTEEGMKSYSCPSCGAELICDETTAATSCPYCGNTTVIPHQFTGARRPDYVIPFKLEKDAAVAALKKHYKGKFLLPRAFIKDAHLDEVKGVYVPFWLFDTKADARVVFDATDESVRVSGDERIITRKHYKVTRGGTVEFERIPVDGSSKMPDAHMDSIEPFNYGEMKEFSMAYLPGFLADKYDQDESACAQRVHDRCRNSAIEMMKDQVTGYTSCIVADAKVSLEDQSVKYALLPVWLLSTKWKDKSYLFAMNGQTGKLVGDLPVDWTRFWLLFVGLVLGFSLLFGFIMQ